MEMNECSMFTPIRLKCSSEVYIYVYNLASIFPHVAPLIMPYSARPIFLSIDRICEILQAHVHPAPQLPKHIDQVWHDSRKITPNGLFVALRGDYMNGHDFLAAAQSNGYIAALVDHHQPDIAMHQIVVPNTLDALQRLARTWRTFFDIPVVAVVGSNGKTTTKEMIASIFHATQQACISTAGNFNNHIGLPLSILQLRSAHQYAVFEIGMNHMGETHDLGRMLQPSVAIITNAQREHQEFMENVDNVAQEHAHIIAYTKNCAIVPAQAPYQALWQKAAQTQGITCYTFGADQDAPDFAFQTQAESINIRHKNQGDHHLKLNILGRHNAYNATGAWAVAHACGIKADVIRQGLESFMPVQGRLQVMRHVPLLINDTYNANPDSVKAAIDVLHEQNGAKLLILGDMGEVGNQAEVFQQEVGQYAYECIDVLFTFGKQSHAAHAAFTALLANAAATSKIAQHFKTIEDLIDATKILAKTHSVLVKGSRFMQMERVVNALMDND